jgi:hypothetical protein
LKEGAASHMAVARQVLDPGNVILVTVSGPRSDSFSRAQDSPTTHTLQLSFSTTAFISLFPLNHILVTFALLFLPPSRVNWHNSCPSYPTTASTMADPVAIQQEIADLEKRIEEAQAQLKDAKSRLQKAQEASFVNPGANMSEEEKMALIKVNLAEVLNPEIMDEALKKQGHLKVYWGTATTGRPHCGYVCAHCEIQSGALLMIYVVVRTYSQACAIPCCRLPC